jgi:LysR family transcriptional regulator for bpeEF and oprC
MDQLQLMQVFTQVVDTNSFSRAAEILNMSRASVSTAFQRLEAHLGGRLMHRSTRRLTLTPDGTVYYERCVRILADIEEMDASLQSLNRKPHGKLRISLPGPIGRLVVIPSLSEFHARYPDIDIQLDLTEREVDLVQEGVDCVVRLGALEDSSLVAKRIGLLEGVTCASPDYLKRAGVPRTLNELKSHRMVSYYANRMGRALDLSFVVDRREVEVRMQGTVSVDDSDAYVACGFAGFGLIQPPRFMVSGHLQRGTLIEVLPEFRPRPMTISILHPQNRYLPPRLRVFKDWITEIFDRCPLLMGLARVDRAVGSMQMLDERGSEPSLDTSRQVSLSFERSHAIETSPVPAARPATPPVLA